MINDEEGLLRSLHTHFKTNLNTKIAEINTEKADFDINLITADNDHYVFAGELLDLPNRSFVQFAIAEEIETESNVDDMISRPLFIIEVAFDNPKKANTYFKSLRYMRALYETMLDYESSTNEVDDVQITKAIPMLVTANKRELVVSGISVSVAIG